MDVDQEEKDLQLFLELDDMEMKEFTLIINSQKQNIKEKNRVGKRRSAKGYKRPYDPYEASTAFTRVEFFTAFQ